MENKISSLLFLAVITTLFSCNRGDKNKNEVNIYHAQINKEYVLIRDVSLLQSSTDTISAHVDSILNGLLDEQIISTGLKSFDLNRDNTTDIQFEIIDLNLFNNGNLPSYLDSMAARVVPVALQILDNSTYGYPDALETDAVIKETGNWSSQTSVLGTFMNAGQFQGMGDRYLGIRFTGNEGTNYGWVKLNCSQHNDTLRIIEYAYNLNYGQEIKAGQKE